MINVIRSKHRTASSSFTFKHFAPAISFGFCGGIIGGGIGLLALVALAGACIFPPTLTCIGIGIGIGCGIGMMMGLTIGGFFKVLKEKLNYCFKKSSSSHSSDEKKPSNTKNISHQNQKSSKSTVHLSANNHSVKLFSQAIPIAPIAPAQQPAHIPFSSSPTLSFKRGLC